MTSQENHLPDPASRSILKKVYSFKDQMQLNCLWLTILYTSMCGKHALKSISWVFNVKKIQNLCFHN